MAKANLAGVLEDGLRNAPGMQRKDLEAGSVIENPGGTLLNKGPEWPPCLLPQADPPQGDAPATPGPGAAGNARRSPTPTTFTGKPLNRPSGGGACVPGPSMEGEDPETQPLRASPVRL